MTTKTAAPELSLDETRKVRDVEPPAPSSLVKTGEPPTSPVATAPNGSHAGAQVVSINQLLQLALEKGTPVEQLKEIVALHREVTRDQAALEFNRAFAEFKRQCPQIHKSKTAKITTKSGGSYSYTFAPLEKIAEVVDPILAPLGFSYGWDAKVDGGKALTCTCTLVHVNGHSRSSSFTLPIENASAMSPQQMVGAAYTFAQRKTLEAVLGLTKTEEDTDGVSREVDPTPINEDQVVFLEDLIKEIKIDRARFLKFLDVAKIEKLPAARYQEAVAALEEKRVRKGAK